MRFWKYIGIVAFILFALLITSTARGRDVGQWENADPETRAWYATVKRSTDQFNCCGEADAYWCDDVHAEGDKVYCLITDDRPDEPLRRNHVPVGTRIDIPPEKYAHSHGNPTGHAIVFLSSGNFVFCFVQNGGV